jgi:hypothetical protein
VRYLQLVLCDRDRRLDVPLRDLAREHRWAYRARLRPASCLRLLRLGCPTVLVLRLGACLADRSLEREFRLLERAARLFPDTRALVVNDAESPALAALAWDLGAAYVLSAAEARAQLSDVVVGLMKSAVRAAGIGGAVR